MSISPAWGSVIEPIDAEPFDRVGAAAECGAPLLERVRYAAENRGTLEG